MEFVAAGLIAGQEVTGHIEDSLVTKDFKTFASKVSKFSSLLGAFNSFVSIIGMFGESAEEQMLERIIKLINEGFNRMENRLDRIETRIGNLENVIREGLFWTNLRQPLQKLSNVQERIKAYLKVTNPAARRQRAKDLDEGQYDNLFDAIKAIEDTFDGKHGKTLCREVTDFTKTNRLQVLSVAVDLYNRLVQASIDKVMIGRLLERDDVEETINDMTEKLRRIGQLIDECDEHIKESAWLNQWRTDLDEVLQKDVFPKGMPYT